MDWQRVLSDFEIRNGTTFLVIQVFVVVFVALLGDFVQKRILARARRAADTTRTVWDDALLEALGPPLSALIWLVGVTAAATVVGRHAEAALFQVIPPLRTIGIVAILTWFAVRFIHALERGLIESPHHPVDATTVDAIGKLLRVSAVITGSLMTLQSLGISISGVLAFGGIGGIAVGFASKDLLSNFFGGLMIYLDRPFAVGDWIRSPDREIEGTVERIGWRLTRIRTFDKRVLYVPNSVFASIALENPSRMSHRRIYETIGIRYADAARMGDIVASVKAMLRSHPEIDATQTLIVNFNSFAPSSLDFFVYTFTRTTEWVKYHSVKQDVLLRIIAIIEAHGAEIAFPTSTVYLADGVRPEPEAVAVREIADSQPA